ncbi:GntR family transcriptional regulator [Actinacidiphila glaucinigra]|uniref:DNA-binding transcriptional regulator, GntR family n=1 Tax=Actinacidiphila glaucinigra TaxID=235986 RepID=A0A239NFA3_9ACTN|nr:GntR family transcriptional regulator [Actinacidiphila glaucinigra]SNT53606.1 DNA-binding transcriptional regulator, GntR family [Actinacidiphila glaucinigra]
MVKRQSVESELRERILRGDLTPGDRLPEVQLAEELGTTRFAVRSALQALEARKLVERTPNAGVVVARLDHDRLQEIYDVLELLEGLAARLAAQKSTPADWAELQELFAEGGGLDEAAEGGDIDVFLAAIDRYRDTVIELADQSFLAEMLVGVRDQSHLLRRRILMTPGRMQESLAEHRMVIDALVRGDAEGAEQLKRHNMQTARKRLSRYRDFLV